MKTFIAVPIVLTITLSAAGFVLAHGPGEETMGSPMMLQMMEMMHGNLDKNKAVNCEAINDEELMEQGEEIMEQMMGKEAHEKVGESMTKEAHDNMHIMMGLWTTGCVGDETMNTMMERHGISQRLEELERKTQNQVGWPAVALGVVIGVVGGWFGNQLLRQKNIGNISKPDKST